MNASLARKNNSQTYGSYSSAALYSFGLHVLVIALGMISVPFLKKDILPPAPIMVEIVDVADMTQTNKVAKAPEKIEKPVPEPKQEKLVAPPKVEAKEPPKVVKPKPIEPEKVKPKPKEVPPPPKPREPEKKPEPKKEELKEEEASQQDQFNSLLKNLQEAENTAAAPSKEIAENVENAPIAPVTQTMAVHELQAVSNHLAQCWNIPIGLEGVHTMVVEINVWPSPSGEVMKAEVVDMIRMQLDDKFRVLAESARNAALNPACSKLPLPMDKRAVWQGKYITIPFDPSWVL